MATKTNSKMIKVINKKGDRVTNLNRDSFMKMKPDESGFRSGWKEFDGEGTNVPGELRSSHPNANVPQELKMHSGKKMFTQEEVDAKVKQAIDNFKAQYPEAFKPEEEENNGDGNNGGEVVEMPIEVGRKYVNKKNANVGGTIISIEDDKITLSRTGGKPDETFSVNPKNFSKGYQLASEE